MTREEAIKIMRKEIECLSHSRCRDCILEKVCDPNTNPTDDEYIEAFGMAINSLEIDERYELEYEQIEPCEDAISRKAVIDGIDNYIEKAQSTGAKDDFISFEELVVKALPSVAPKPKTDVLDKIRTEIEQIEIHGNLRDVECFSAGINAALNVIDKYKAESEDKE